MITHLRIDHKEVWKEIEILMQRNKNENGQQKIEKYANSPKAVIPYFTLTILLDLWNYL